MSGDSSVPEEWGHLPFVFLSPCFFYIFVSLAAMMCRNKVSPASTYLNDVQSGADEAHVRVGVVRFVGSIHILELVFR